MVSQDKLEKCEVGRSGSKEAEESASWVESKEKKKIKLLVPFSLSVSCPSLGDRSLPIFIDVRSYIMSEVDAYSKLLEKRSKIWEDDLVWREGLVFV